MASSPPYLTPFRGVSELRLSRLRAALFCTTSFSVRVRRDLFNRDRVGMNMPVRDALASGKSAFRGFNRAVFRLCRANLDHALATVEWVT